jgi:hypothetical protein
MLAVLIPAGIAFWIWKSSRKREMSSSQKAVLDKALASQNPDAIAKVAVAFGREGHGEAMRRLKLRAGLALREPAEVMLHCEAFRNALAEPTGRGTTMATREVALKLKRRGLTECGKFLEDYARGVERCRSIAPVYVPPLGPSGAPETGPIPSVVPNTFDSESAAREPRDPDLPPGVNPGDPPIDMAPIVDEDLPPIVDQAGGMS